jgi:hypothetical protein
MHLKKCLTFETPSLITLSISDFADLKKNQACLLSMGKGKGLTSTSAWRLQTGEAL